MGILLPAYETYRNTAAISLWHLQWYALCWLWS